MEWAKPPETGRALGELERRAASELRRIAVDLVSQINEALRERDYTRVSSMMHADGYWRDLLTFGWNFRNLHGIDNIRAWLAEAFELNAADDFRLEGEPTIGAIGEHDRTLEFFFTFDTGIADGRGHARLVEISNSPDGLKAFTILTAMKELKKYPQATARNRARDDLRVTSRELENWRDRRKRHANSRTKILRS